MREIMQPTNIGLKGVVTLELFDAKTGKLQNRVKKENFISPTNKMWWARQQRDSIIDKMPIDLKNQSQRREYFFNSEYFFNRIILTDYSSSENPNNEKLIRGNIIGQVDIRNIATSTHETAGVLNLNESYIDNEVIHIVADFGTDRGNGTFQSIGFTNCYRRYNEYNRYGGFYYGFVKYLDYKDDGSTENLTTKIGNKLIYKGKGGSSSFYVFDLDNPELGVQLLFNLPEPVRANGLTTDGINLFICYGSSIKEYSLSGNLIRTIDTPVLFMEGIYFDIDEDVFYATSYSSGTNPIGLAWNECIYKINKDTGEIIEIYEKGFDVNYDICGKLSDGRFIFVSGSTVSSNRVEAYAIIKNLNDNYYIDVLVPGIRGNTLPAVDKDIIYSINFQNEENYFVSKVYPSMACSRVLLPSPQTKNNTQTMKLTYDLYYTDWTRV